MAHRRRTIRPSTSTSLTTHSHTVYDLHHQDNFDDWEVSYYANDKEPTTIVGKSLANRWAHNRRRRNRTHENDNKPIRILWKRHIVWSMIAAIAIVLWLPLHPYHQADADIPNYHDETLCPILIPSLDLRQIHAAYRIAKEPRKFPSWDTLLIVHRRRFKKNYEADYGGLHINHRSYSRQEEVALSEQDDPRDHHHYNSKYRSYDMPDEPLGNCTLPSWTTIQHPNCPFFHEFDLSRPNYDPNSSISSDYETVSSAHGYFRDVWILSNKLPITESRDSLAIKTIRYRLMDHMAHALPDVHHDASIMDRLSASERIVNVHGHCGTGVLVEVVQDDLANSIVPGSGYLHSVDLDENQNPGPRNNYTANEKLDIALTMAESLADLHGDKDGPIVHDDVQLSQWLRRRDGSIVLGDFNRAKVLGWEENGGEGRWCKYNNGPAVGNVSFCIALSLTKAKLRSRYCSSTYANSPLRSLSW